MTGLALRWILDHPEVSTVITGAKNDVQIVENSKSSDLPELGSKLTSKLNSFYAENIKESVHQRW